MISLEWSHERCNCYHYAIVYILMRLKFDLGGGEGYGI